MSEKRRKPRQRTFKGGSITLPSGIVDCIVRNVSASGALLELKTPVLIPNDFELIIKPELSRRFCRVVRRDALQLGVHFVSGL